MRWAHMCQDLAGHQCSSYHLIHPGMIWLNILLSLILLNKEKIFPEFWTQSQSSRSPVGGHCSVCSLLLMCCKVEKHANSPVLTNSQKCFPSRGCITSLLKLGWLFLMSSWIKLLIRIVWSSKCIREENCATSYFSNKKTKAFLSSVLCLSLWGVGGPDWIDSRIHRC